MQSSTSCYQELVEPCTSQAVSDFTAHESCSSASQSTQSPLLTSGQPHGFSEVMYNSWFTEREAEAGSLNDLLEMQVRNRIRGKTQGSHLPAVVD